MNNDVSTPIHAPLVPCNTSNNIVSKLKTSTKINFNFLRVKDSDNKTSANEIKPMS